jgi:TRAP-type mannitol/chloroaromatic compound transport system permease small subunit
MAYAFNKPTLWNFDFSMQMYGAILMMSGAYCLATEAHVRGDVIYRLFKERTQAWIDLVLYFIFFFPGVIALAFYGYEYAALAWKIKETSWSSPAQIQIYMVKSMIPCAGVLLIIQGISEVFQISNLYKNRSLAIKNGCCRRNRAGTNETIKSGGTKRCCLV